MKGSSEMPQCGFSANVINMLTSLNKDFATYDILADPELRQALKEYSNWPTFPQFYFKGELIGGNDIMVEMYQSGELEKLLNS